ncbi:MAG: VTT domain-containing protein [Bdellovibrionaceae bacterium]|nr:VTT domain-containing protein [Pseudobdellovibrionaceae bacterium]
MAQPKTSALSLNPFVWVRRIYDWTIRWAEHRRSTQALSAVAFAESIFFPIPPDVLLLIMGAARPKKALWFAFLCSLFSILGGLAGYWIGAWAWDIVGEWFFRYVFSRELFIKVGGLFEQNAFWAIFTAAFTPIPFKVFTVSAGAFGISLLPFVVGMTVGRPLRFLTVGLLLYFFGTPVRAWVERYFNTLTVIFTLLLLGGFWVLKHLT